MLIAGRMLSESFNESVNATVSIGVLATLRVDFTYYRFGVEVTLEQGTTIHVDEEKGWACHGDDYFEIDTTDYVVSYLN